MVRRSAQKDMDVSAAVQVLGETLMCWGDLAGQSEEAINDAVELLVLLAAKAGFNPDVIEDFINQRRGN